MPRLAIASSILDSRTISAGSYLDSFLPCLVSASRKIKQCAISRSNFHMRWCSSTVPGIRQLTLFSHTLSDYPFWPGYPIQISLSCSGLHVDATVRKMHSPVVWQRSGKSIDGFQMLPVSQCGSQSAMCCDSYSRSQDLHTIRMYYLGTGRRLLLQWVLCGVVDRVHLVDGLVHTRVITVIWPSLKISTRPCSLISVAHVARLSVDVSSCTVSTEEAFPILCIPRQWFDAIGSSRYVAPRDEMPGCD